jgi:16S rRNA (guanine527-N7)-methyltransferase
VNQRDPELVATLELARDRGFLGPGPVDAHFVHARGFIEVAESAGANPELVVDLGTGGGVPGLVLAQAWPEARVVLVEAMARRATHLREAVTRLGWGQRVQVDERRAELVARDPDFRERVDVVTARGFSAPAVTAEIAAGLAAQGSIVVVSEPPSREPDRWPSTGLAKLGFDGPEWRESVAGAHYVVLRKRRSTPASVPRSVGKPGKRPLW